MHVSIEFGKQRHTIPQEVANELSCRAARITQLTAENKVLRKALGDEEADEAIKASKDLTFPIQPEKEEKPTPAPAPKVAPKPNPVLRKGGTSPFQGAPKR